MGDHGIKPVARTYYEISNIKHTEVKAPLDYSKPVFTYLKNAYTDKVLQPISVKDLGQIINQYSNAKGGKFADRCLLKGKYKGGFSGSNCYQNAPYLFFDIDIKPDKENNHLIQWATNEVTFKELQKVAVICWRSNSGLGMAGVLYVPQLAQYLEPDKDLHLLAGKAITEHLSDYLHNKTGIEKIVFDPAQSKFRQVRFLAQQKQLRHLNPTPLKFTYTAEQKIKYKEAGVIDYRRSDYKAPNGTIYSQFDNDNSIIKIALDNGFNEVSRSNDKVRIKHPDTTSATSGVIDQTQNIYFNHSESFSHKKAFSPSSLLCRLKFNNNWAKFRAHLTGLGYQDKAKTKDEVKTVSDALKKELATITDHEEAGEIIFSYCNDLKTLPAKRKHQFIKDTCQRSELKRYFKAYLKLTNYRVKYDKEFTINKYVSEVLPEILNYADQHSKVLLRAETGKGKTTALFSIPQHRPNASILVAVPLTIINDQNKQDHKGKALFLDGQSTPTEFEQAENASFIFATYEQASKILVKRSFDFIIIDEVHQLITANSYKKETIRKLTTGFNDRSKLIGLTGTPNNIFRNIGFKLLNIDVERPVKTPVEVRILNSAPFGIALHHLRTVKGKTLIRFNITEDLKSLKKQLVLTNMYKADEVLVLYSADKVKNSKAFKKLAHQRVFADKIKLALTTSLIDEGLSIEQNGFTDVVFIETSYIPRAEAVKQFFARFRNIDPDRKNYLYLRSKNDQSPTLFNPVWTYNDYLQGLKEDADLIDKADLKTAYNAEFSNEDFYYNDKNINPYFLGFTATDILFRAFNLNQFLDFLEDNYNLKILKNEAYQPNFDGLQSIAKNETKKRKQKTANLWLKAKDEVLQVLALRTLNTSIRNDLTTKQMPINPDLEVFVIDNIKRFEKLYKDSKKLKNLDADDPDQILITTKMTADSGTVITLNSNKKVKDEMTLLKLKKQVFEPNTTTEERIRLKLIVFTLWCKNKGEFTTQQMRRKLKSLRIFKSYSFEQIKRILNWFNLEVKKDTKTKLIKVAGKWYR